MNIIPFESAKVPAVVTQMFGDSAKDLIGNAPSGGFPVLSIKGKVFHIQRGDERTLVTKPGEDDPAASLEVVIIRANPNNSKVYYKSGYVDGGTDKPTCYSNNGIEPEADAAEPQSKKCAACPHYVWGSKITEAGKKGRECAESRRIAIATVDTPADPMLVRVPAASMKALSEYGKILAARGVGPEAVITKIGFDHSVAHPQLTFRPVGFIGDAEALAKIKDAAQSDLAQQIIGLLPSEENDTPDGEIEQAAPPATKAAAPKTTAKPKPTPAPAADPVDAAVAAVKVETAAPSPAVAALESQLESMLDDMEFDD